jgi:hypothetical protein
MVALGIFRKIIDGGKLFWQGPYDNLFVIIELNVFKKGKVNRWVTREKEIKTNAKKKKRQANTNREAEAIR